jgi:hypothetical protein
MLEFTGPRLEIPAKYIVKQTLCEAMCTNYPPSVIGAPGGKSDFTVLG